MAYAAPVLSAPPVVIPDNGATPAAKYTKTWLSPGFYQWTVPSGVTVVGVTLAGASGSSGFNDAGSGGNGGELSDQLMDVSPGETLNIYVGESGGYGYGYGYVGGGGSSAVVNPNTGQVVMAPGGGSGVSYSPLSGAANNGGGGGGYTNGGDSNGGYGGGGNGGNANGSITGGNGGYPGGAGYNGNGAPSGIIPGPGYGFVEIQWN